MKKTLHTIAVIAGVVTGLAAVIGPVIYLVRRFMSKHASALEE